MSQLATSFSSGRSRCVRFCYPEEFVALAFVLSRKYPRAKVAKALGLPASTLYRWIASSEKNDAALLSLEQLISCCVAKGFELRAGLVALGVGQAELDACCNVSAVISTSSTAPDADDPSLARADYAWPCSAQTRAAIERVRGKIEQHYYTRLTLDQMAVWSGLSKFHFAKAFRFICGASPHRYLMKVRVRRARHLLLSTEFPLDMVASAVGFDAVSSMAKAVKAVEGRNISVLYWGMAIKRERKQAS